MSVQFSQIAEIAINLHLMTGNHIIFPLKFLQLDFAHNPLLFDFLVDQLRIGILLCLFLEVLLHDLRVFLGVDFAICFGPDHLFLLG